MDLFLASIFCSTDLCVCFFPVPYCFDDHSLVIEPEVRELATSSTVVVLQDSFAYLGSFVFQTNFKFTCPNSVKIHSKWF